MFVATKIFVLLACCLALSRAVPAGVPGGHQQLSGSELKGAEEELQASLNKLAAGEGPHYKILKVHSATKQVVAGFITSLNVDLIDEKDVTKECVVSIWKQIKEKDDVEVTFDCKGEDKLVKSHSS